MSRAPSVLLSVVVAAAVATPASAAPKHSNKSPQEISSYWTAERMKNAKPRERVKPGGGGGGGGAADWSTYAVALSGGAYAGADRQNGKVFFSMNGGNYVCSGTAVTPKSAVNLVWTAGHCVTDGGALADFATNFLFVPGYYRGAEPYGRWAATSLDSTPGWEAQGSDRFDYDVGAARVVKDGSAATSLGSAIGGTRSIVFGYDPTPNKRIVSIGYPASGKFNGSQQFACASPFRRWDTLFGDPMQISCDMTGGSSGGGWFADTDGDRVADPAEPLISVNSYGYQGERNTMYGPYLGTSQAQALYNTMG